MVEGSGLENQRASDRAVGSNPTLSAISNATMLRRGRTSAHRITVFDSERATPERFISTFRQSPFTSSPAAIVLHLFSSLVYGVSCD